MTKKRSYSPCVACRQLFEAGTLAWHSNKCASCSEFGPDGDGVGADPEPMVIGANARNVVKRGDWYAVEL